MYILLLCNFATPQLCKVRKLESRSEGRKNQKHTHKRNLCVCGKKVQKTSIFSIFFKPEYEFLYFL